MPEAPSSEPVHVVFQCTNGIVLALYAAANYEPHYGPAPDGFRAFTLCVNCRDWDEVLHIHEEVAAMDDVHQLDDEPQMGTWGGGGFSFRDPEGNVCDVAWKDGSRFDERGGLTFP